MNSRRKGANNERKIAALFTKWTGRTFAKTPASGGLQWKSSFSKGDIVCTKEGHYFPFCIEAKFHIKIDFAHLMIPGINCEIIDFWLQCQRDAQLCNKIPILFMRYNGLKADFHFVIVTQEYAKNIHPLLPKNLVSLRYQNYGSTLYPPLMILRSTDFFKTNYKAIKENAKIFIKTKPKKGN